MKITEINEGMRIERKPLKKRTVNGIEIFQYPEDYVIQSNFGTVSISAKDMKQVINVISKMVQS